VAADGLVIHFCNVDPAAVKCEGTCLAKWILNADDTGILVACVLDDVKPVVVLMLTGTLELRARP
jgi:hypothetical protein